MFSQLKSALLLTVALTVFTGLLYPLAITGLGTVLFPKQAHGSLVMVDGKVIGSDLIGQQFTKPYYFIGRPSAITSTGPDPKDPTKTVTTADPYDASNSMASNYAPTAKGLISDVSDRIKALKAANPHNTDPIPADLVTTSASGLDPDISPASAYWQVEGVAAARHASPDAVRTLIADTVEGRTLGVLGEPRVNVLHLNMALDAKFPMPK